MIPFVLLFTTTLGTGMTNRITGGTVCVGFAFDTVEIDACAVFWFACISVNAIFSSGQTITIFARIAQFSASLHSSVFLLVNTFQILPRTTFTVTAKFVYIGDSFESKYH